MAGLKTTENDADVVAFLEGVEHPRRRADAHTLLELFGDVTGKAPRMWGPSIVGFGRYHYVYESGREGDWMLTGFSPRKQNLSLYIMSGFDGCDGLLERLGKHRTGRSCLYVNTLDDIDLDVLRELVSASVTEMRRRHG